jgi:TonB family protein
MSALIYRPNNRWRFAGALLAAAIIHLAAIGFATTHQTERTGPSGPVGEPPETFVGPVDLDTDLQPELSDPLPAPPTPNEFYVNEGSTPPPVRTLIMKSRPFVRSQNAASPRSLSLSFAKVLAVNAPRPEYPYEARRQQITGDGIAVMSVDSASGAVIAVTMAKSTGNRFLDNAAIAGFRRWRFKPRSVSNVTCPLTFTLTGASY